MAPLTFERSLSNSCWAPKMQSNNAKPNISPFKPQSQYQRRFCNGINMIVFFPFIINLFLPSSNRQTDGTSRDIAPHTSARPPAPRRFHYQEAERLGSSCFPLRHRAPSRGSSLVTFPHPRPRSTPATGCSRSDSLKATKGARQFTGDFAESRGNPREPGAGGQSEEPAEL